MYSGKKFDQLFYTCIFIDQIFYSLDGTCNKAMQMQKNDFDWSLIIAKSDLTIVSE